MEENADSRSGDPNFFWREETFNTAIDAATLLMEEKFSGQFPSVYNAWREETFDTAIDAATFLLKKTFQDREKVLSGLRSFLPYSFDKTKTHESLKNGASKCQLLHS